MGQPVMRVAVLGSGLMGSGIAQVCATHGRAVRLFDTDAAALGRAHDSMAASLARLVRRGDVKQANVPTILGRVTPGSDLAGAVADADVVIEAVPEILDLKRALFAEVDRLAPCHAILASNTSNLSITAIAAATGRPAQVIGMHWFNPPPMMRLIEVARGIETSDETVATLRELASDLGKETVVCKDSQGFITSRISLAIAVEAFRILEEGVGSKEDIDTAVRLGLNHPLGPLELADLTGLDTNLFVAETLTEVYGDRFRPPNILRNLVRARRLGRKTGHGVYEYDADGRRTGS